VRVVSLVSSATEIACALGFEKTLVGRSHECDFPSSIASLPKLTTPRLDPEAGSAEIDRQVRAGAEARQSLYEVDGEALRALRPDVILTQAQCEVCAVSFKDVEAALAGPAPIKAAVVPLGGADLPGVWADIRRVAKALEDEASGRALLSRLEARLAELERRARRLPRPRVLCLEWLEPLMASGNWVPELVRAAGGEPVFGKAGAHSPTIGWDEVRRADPDCIVALPCGFDVERTLREREAVTGREGWGRLRAVRTGRVFAADGNAYFNRPGPRLVDSAELLAEMLHPAEFPPAREGRSWKRLA
jgi:iron complex transport system substrate-binding protein